MFTNNLQSTPPEIKLILSCARANLDEEHIQSVQTIIQGNINWRLVSRYLETYRVSNLVYPNLKKHFESKLPKEFCDDLERRYQISLIHNLALTQELYTLLECLEQEGVEVIPYKGTFLSLELYGDLGRRPFGDIDLVIRRRDIERVERILNANGYRRTWPKPDVSNFIRDSHLRQKYNYKYEHYKTQSVLELHWGILPGYFLPAGSQELLWETAKRKELGERSILCFSIESYLIALCAHGANHCWLYELRLICDVGEYVFSHPEINWHTLFQDARKMKLERVVGLGLWLAYHILSADIPAQIMREIEKDTTVSRLGNRASLQLLHFFPPQRFYVPRFQLALCVGLWSKLRYLLSLLEPSEKDHEDFHLSERFAWLYFLLRPLRLIREHVGQPPKPQ